MARFGNFFIETGDYLSNLHPSLERSAT
ncbi:hypothetical protein EMIT0P100_10974 [Pseudomonas sp. IT-P100]